MSKHIKTVTVWVSLMAASVGVIAQGVVFGQEPQPARKITKKTTPAYPAFARHANISGTVKLLLVVSPEGTVKSVRTIGGNPVLASAATEAVKQWHFEPAAKESSEAVALKFAK